MTEDRKDFYPIKKEDAYDIIEQTLKDVIMTHGETEAFKMLHNYWCNIVAAILTTNKRMPFAEIGNYVDSFLGACKEDVMKEIKWMREMEL